MVGLREEIFDVQECSVIMCAIFVGLSLWAVQAFLNQQCLKVVQRHFFLRVHMAYVPSWVTVHFYSRLHSVCWARGRHVVDRNGSEKAKDRNGVKARLGLRVKHYGTESKLIGFVDPDVISGMVRNNLT